MINNSHKHQIITRETHDLYYCESSFSDEAIIYCHGGAFRYGDKSDNSAFLAALAEKTRMRVYSVGFRNIDEARSLKTMIDDINNSINTIVRCDSISHFHMMGASSGAYLAWILSLFVLNPEKYDICLDYKLKSVTLISGYYLFKPNDPITQMLCLFPAFQDFPQEIRNVDMTYSGFNLAPMLLITGTEDSCLEDSKVLYDALTKSKVANVEIKIFESDADMADHCFIIDRPDADVSQKALDCIYSFIKVNQINCIWEGADINSI